MSNLSRNLLIALMIVSTILAASSIGLARAGGTAPVPWTRLAQQGESTENTNEAHTRVSLSKEVRHELIMLPYYNLFDWLEYEIQPGNTVILRGQVVRPLLKSDAEQAVNKIEGVTKVVNKIELLPLSPSDDHIRQAVYRALFNWNSPLFRYALQAVPSIHIVVRNGNVTLKGVVDSTTDSDLANIKARGVPGVFEVKNELQIERGEIS
jgi:hyperosmotically inducible protein